MVDASTLVGELLRERGHRLLASPHLDLYVPAWMWDETRHEVHRRLGIMVNRGLPESLADRFWEAALRVKERSVIEVPEEVYEGLKDEALSRLPRDTRDWQVVALALSLGADILTEDGLSGLWRRDVDGRHPDRATRAPGRLAFRSLA